MVGPDTSAFARLVGQEAVVEEVRGRLDAISAGADSGEDAHVFFFYGFSGTGKTYLAELMAHAVHGSTALPHYKKFAMQNYKTDEDMWTLVSPPCGLKGKEGAFQQLFRPREASAERKGHSPPTPGPVLVFDEIEEARQDFMTSALINAIDHRGFVEYRLKPESDDCTSTQVPTGGAFFVLTSNCFMDDLAEVLGRENVPGRPSSEIYKATRAEMDRRIFEELIPCSRISTKASPFAAGKMRDRMRGNVWPFLPLSAKQQMATFELALEQRAVLYEEFNRVSLYWTREFAQLAMLPPDATSTMPSSRANATTVTPSISVRKRIDMLMRLDATSVERLYAAGVARCRPSRMHTLVLHVRGGKPAGEALCDDSSNTTSQRVSPAWPPPAPVALPSSSRHPPPSHALTGARPSGSSDDMTRAFAHDADLDVSSAARSAASHSDTETQLRLQLDAATKRSSELQVELETLHSKLKEYERVILYWKLGCALFAVVSIATFILALLSTGYVYAAYFTLMAKCAIWSVEATTTVVLVVWVTALLLCQSGSVGACGVVEFLCEVAQYSWDMACMVVIWLYWLTGLLGLWGVVAVFLFAFCLMLIIHVSLQQLLSTPRNEANVARRDIDRLQRERDDAYAAADARARRLADVDSLLDIEKSRAMVDSQTTRAEIRCLEDEWCIVASSRLSREENIHSLEDFTSSDSNDDFHFSARSTDAPASIAEIVSADGRRPHAAPILRACMSAQGLNRTA
jgi:hypothetical protein